MPGVLEKYDRHLFSLLLAEGYFLIKSEDMNKKNYE